MKKTLLLFFLSMSFFLSAKAFSISQDSIVTIADYLQAHHIPAKQTDKGLYYHIERQGKGAYPQTGDYVKVRFTGSLLNGQVFDASKDDEPFVFQLGHRQVILGWEFGIPLFDVGSKGILLVPSELAYGSRGVGKVPPNTPLLFEIELLEIMNFEQYDAYIVELEKKQRQRFEEEKQRQFREDKKLIQEYIISHKIKRAKRDDSGISYAITKKGKGALPKSGDIIEVAYSGFLINGTSFDKGTYTVELGKEKVIPGWEEGLPYFKKGSEGWILIPSKLAYGPRPIEEDDISIPANSVLIFKIKILDIERKD